MLKMYKRNKRNKRNKINKINKINKKQETANLLLYKIDNKLVIYFSKNDIL